MEKTEVDGRPTLHNPSNQILGSATDNASEGVLLFPEETASIQQFRKDMAAGAKSKQPKVKIDKVLRQQAHADYQAARGTAHRQLLLDAEERLQRQAQAVQKRVAALQKEVAGLEAARDSELRQVLVRPMVEKELPALPGIGPRLAEAILTQVFRGNLEDLQRAFLIDGIGPQKQAAINAWVARQQAQLPTLLSEYFPGKGEINARYDREISAPRAALKKAQTDARDNRNVLEQVYQELLWLISILPRDFELAFTDGQGRPQHIERYILGCFPPWEAMPDWFIAAIGAGNPEPVMPVVPIHIVNHPSDYSQDSSDLEERIIIRD